ncbi:hypothetical protein ACEZ7K_003609 [Salmonella enterica]
MNKTDSHYILCSGYSTLLSDKKASKYLPYYGRVMSSAEWGLLGIEVKTDKYGIPVRPKIGAPYYFRRVISYSEAEKEAIATGKRLYSNEQTLVDFARMDISFDEFVSHPFHMENYALAVLAWEASDLVLATELFKVAITDSPENVTYKQKYFAVRLENDDLTAISEELTFFSRDIDSLIHSGRFDEWLKKLFIYKQYSFAANLVLKVDGLFGQVLAGELAKGYYGTQSPDFVSHKRDQFREKVKKLCNSSRYSPFKNALEDVGWFA